MSLILLNLQSNQLIKLDNDNPLIIGRGNVEGCFDKRVSRNHGRITCTLDGKIRLEALHCNPCFFTRNGVPPIKQINKNEEETLNKGDYLGLLPNAFWFKITSNNEGNIKNEPEIKVVCNEDAPSLPAKSNIGLISQAEETVVFNKTSISNDMQNKSNLSSSPLPPSNSENSTKCLGIPEFERTRRLPLWMYEIDEPVSSNKILNKCSSTSSKSPKHSLSTSSDTNHKKPKFLPDSEIKRESDKESEREADCKLTMSDVPSTSKLGNTIESQTSVFQSGSQAKEESNKNSLKKEGYESNINNEMEDVARSICKYGGNCYRKNPQHKLEFSHPGDSDFVPYEQRPVCEFGAACFRTNERHRIEFRHPSPDSGSRNLSPSSCSGGSRASSPLPAKRRRKKVKKGNSDYGDDDEYDLEDPFINDASSDEFIPSDLESEEQQEDLDTSPEND